MSDFAIFFGVIISRVVMAIICCLIARNRGRSPVGWFFIGFFLDCIGLILVLVLPDTNQEQEREESERRRRRRLEEELMQERMKNQAFRGHASTRLDAHDSELGIDTKSGAPSALPPPPAPRAHVEGVPADGWYVAMPGHEPEGPLAVSEVQARIEAGDVNKRTLVWHESFDDWKTAGDSPLHIWLS